MSKKHELQTSDILLEAPTVQEAKHTVTFKSISSLMFTAFSAYFIQHLHHSYHHHFFLLPPFKSVNTAAFISQVNKVDLIIENPLFNPLKINSVSRMTPHTPNNEY